VSVFSEGLWRLSLTAVTGKANEGSNEPEPVLSQHCLTL
jgi:hypothetical protein